MKSVFLLVAAISIAAASCGQNIASSKVPSVVQNTVQAKYASAAKLEWEKKEKLYEAEFTINNTDYSVLIDETGKIVSSKTNILVTDLPAGVTAAITKDYAGYTIDEAEKVEKDGVTYYQVELEAKGKKDREVVFTTAGVSTKAISYIN
jgi:uncharacterized membrane protein YkoI